jgi:hypothetical protein
MAKDATYKVGGVSRLGGAVKVRFTHDVLYVKGLTKAGNTDVQLIEAPSLMTKEQMVEWLKTTDLYQNPEYREAIDARGEMYAPKVAKAPKVKAVKPAKVVKVKATKPSLDAIKARKPKAAKAEVAAPAEVVEAAPEAVAE